MKSFEFEAKKDGIISTTVTTIAEAGEGGSLAAYWENNRLLRESVYARMAKEPFDQLVSAIVVVTIRTRPKNDKTYKADVWTLSSSPQKN